MIVGKLSATPTLSSKSSNGHDQSMIHNKLDQLQSVVKSLNFLGHARRHFNNDQQRYLNVMESIEAAGSTNVAGYDIPGVVVC